VPEGFHSIFEVNRFSMHALVNGDESVGAEHDRAR
jgi:hypothetical protein